MAQQAEQQRTRTRDPIGDTFDIGEQGVGEGFAAVPYGSNQGGMPSILPGRQGDTSLNILAGNITAQRVVVPRNIEKVQRELKALAAMAGKEWVWGWFVKDKRAPGGKSWIEGPTIKLANDLARTWGNCDIRPMVVDEGTQWMFYARFVDLETGYTLIRAFQQRKGQNTGMQDNARALDMIFQLGQSKAIRNVIVNALQTIATFCVEEAKGSEIDKIKKDPDKARAVLLRKLEQNGVDLKRVEKLYGRAAANWTPENMAKIMSEVMAFADGMGDQAEIWPLAEDDQGETIRPKAETTMPAGDTNAGAGETAAGDAADKAAAVAAAAAAAAAAVPLAEGERIVVLEGGINVGKLAREVELGDTITEFGSRLRVVEYTDKQIVVERAPAAAQQAKQEPEKQQTKPASKKPAGGKTKLFQED